MAIWTDILCSHPLSFMYICTIPEQLGSEDVYHCVISPVLLPPLTQCLVREDTNC